MTDDGPGYRLAKLLRSGSLHGDGSHPSMGMLAGLQRDSALSTWAPYRVHGSGRAGGPGPPAGSSAPCLQLLAGSGRPGPLPPMAPFASVCGYRSHAGPCRCSGCHGACGCLCVWGRWACMRHGRRPSYPPAIRWARGNLNFPIGVLGFSRFAKRKRGDPWPHQGAADVPAGMARGEVEPAGGAEISRKA